MEVRLLGPVEVHAGGCRLEVRPRQRLVALVALAIDAGLVVPVDTLIRRIWERPPKQDRRTVHAHISHLRRVLRAANAAEPDQPPAQLVRRAGGYALQIDPKRVDLHRFRTLAARARAATDGWTAEALFAEAARLWRGDALAGLSTPWSASVRVSLEQERLSVELDRADVRLGLGQHAQLVDGLAEVAATRPLDERLAGQYMLALYRCGRQADALAHYERVRKRLDRHVAVLSPPLRALRQRILSGDPGLFAVAANPASASEAEPPPRADRTLPADVAGFVGRHTELLRLLDAMDTTAAGSVGAVAICAVDGMAGVGKTAFAVHAAHHLATRFPDGQRFVALRAHAPGQTAVDPAAALEVLLQADGVAAHQVPAGVDARAGLWRERIAGKKMLLVLDDAADIAHLTPLLPTGPGCLVLITSRRKLATLPGVTVLSLNPLPPADAAQLFVHRAGARWGHDEPSVRRITQLCGYLPLAIALTAARLHTHPTWTVADLAGVLSRARDRLSELASGELAVSVALDLSYRDLPADRQRSFRRLALHPGPDFDAYAAAALHQETLATTCRRLEELLEHNLLTEPHRGRYRFHNLVAAHASTLAAADPESERDAALDRLLSYYLVTATTAAARQRDGFTPVAAAAAADTQPMETPSIADPQQAADWFTAEQQNLAAVSSHAADRRHPAAIAIPAAVNDHLRHRGPSTLQCGCTTAP